MERALTAACDAMLGFNIPRKILAVVIVLCFFFLHVFDVRVAGMNFEQLTREWMNKIGFTCGLWYRV